MIYLCHPYACFMSTLSHASWVIHPNIWWAVSIAKLISVSPAGDNLIVANYSASPCLCMYHHHHHHHHHHHLSVMELGHLLTRSGLTYPEVSSKVCHDSFCQLGNSVSLPWVIYYEAFHLHVVYVYIYICVCVCVCVCVYMYMYCNSI